MEKGILKLEEFTSNDLANRFRTIIKTKHGRVMFLLLEINDTDYTITDCFYTDRNQGRTGAERYSSKPLKLNGHSRSRMASTSTVYGLTGIFRFHRSH